MIAESRHAGGAIFPGGGQRGEAGRGVAQGMRRAARERMRGIGMGAAARAAARALVVFAVAGGGGACTPGGWGLGGGAAADAGGGDTDAGGIIRPPGPVPACLTGPLAGGVDASRSYTGTAVVTEHAPLGADGWWTLSFAAADGQPLTLGYVAGGASLPLATGEAVTLDVRQQDQGWWIDTTAVITRDGAVAELVGILWSTTGGVPAPSVGPIALAYADQGCAGVPAQCGLAAPWVLVVGFKDTPETSVAPGTTLARGGYAIGNGSDSFLTVGPVTCDDATGTWATGWVVAI